MDVKPALANLSEGILNNFFESANPALLSSVEFYLSDTRGLNLFEFFDTKSLAFNGNIKDTVI